VRRFQWRVAKAKTHTHTHTLHLTPQLRINGRLAKLKLPDATLSAGTVTVRTWCLTLYGQEHEQVGLLNRKTVYYDKWTLKLWRNL
jgi:hypothetical protein